MGVRYAREYELIVKDLAEAIMEIEDSFVFFDMDKSVWESLDEGQQRECMRTLADDLFFALGADPSLEVGKGVVRYEEDDHIIKVFNGEKCIHIVNLI